MGPVVVLAVGLHGTALAVGIFGEHAFAHGGAAPEGKAEFATVAEAVDNIVAVGGALNGDKEREKLAKVLSSQMPSGRAGHGVRTHVVVCTVGRHCER